MTIARQRPLPMRVLLGDDPTDIDLDALQGTWTEMQYLRLTEATNWLIEFTDGVIEVLPMPTHKHQAISKLLLFALTALLQPRGGTVFYSPLPMQIRSDKYREPDLLVLLDKRDPRKQNAFWLGADLVIEIVSPRSTALDIVEKRADYAEAGIPEYWIVNPLDETFTVLRLVEERYVEHGVFRRSDTATSALLPEFAVAVSTVFDAE